MENAVKKEEFNMSMLLADAIRSISSMIHSDAGCEDISTATVQWAVRLLPGARAIILEVEPGRKCANVLATANAPFVTRGQGIPLSESCVVNLAVNDPYRVQRAMHDNGSHLFPAADGYPGEPDDIVSAKAVPKTDQQMIVIALVSDQETAALAEGLLMTLSELLIVLCVGHEATIRHSECVQDVQRAKREWERTVDALPEIVCLCDQNGVIVRANRTIERWGLAKVNRVAGTHVHKLFHPDCDAPACALKDATSPRLAAEASNAYLESAITDAVLGRNLIVHTQVIEDLPIQSQPDPLPCAVVVVSDISSLHRAQNELASLNHELENRVTARTEQLEATNKDLAEEVARRRTVERDLQSSRDELAELSQQLINAQEEERRRLSRELHDSLGQSLGAIKYSLERVVAMQEKAELGDPVGEITKILDHLGDVISETRSMAVSLRPPLLDDIGTASAIGWLCKHFAETFSDIEFHIEIDVPNSDIPDDLATPVYRIVQEALNNVVKHAEAVAVMVSLRHESDKLRLEIIDDGVGFETNADDTGSFRRLGKIGRLGMRERALNSDGQLQIESWPGEGTRVLAEWALPKHKSKTE